MSELTIPIAAGRVAVSSPFGMRNGVMHRGADFVPRPQGNPAILAYADGVVINVIRLHHSAGNWVDIRHTSRGITTTYMHLDTVSPGIREGAVILRGQLIGTMGSTGNSTGIHLHFEVSPQLGRGNQVDPMPFLVGRSNDMRVLIDPGHAPGNANGGSNGYREYAGMWALSCHLMEMLTSAGITVQLTRRENENPTLEARGGMARGFDLFISQHSNAHNGAVRGSECFFSSRQPQNRAIAARFSADVARLFGHNDRGAKPDDGFAVIRAAVAAGCPRVFLMESGFHDNALDEAFLLQDANLRRIARAQADIILNVLQSPVVDESPVVAAPFAGQFMVQLGAFGKQQNAETLARRVRASGHSATVRADGSLHRVLAGGFYDRRDAERLVGELAALGFNGAFVVW